MRDPRVTLYRHNTPGGGSILVRRMTVARHAEIVTAFCAPRVQRLLSTRSGALLPEEPRHRRGGGYQVR